MTAGVGKCEATRGYCECNLPDDGHLHHHCPECAAHPVGGHVFSWWSDNPLIPSEYRTHESMHEYAEYAATDPWTQDSRPMIRRDRQGSVTGSGAGVDDLTIADDQPIRWELDGGER